MNIPTYFKILGSAFINNKVAIQRLFATKVDARGNPTEYSITDNQDAALNEILATQCEPIISAITMYSEATARLGAMLYDVDNEDNQKKVENKMILDQYYNFLLSKYSTKQSYNLLMSQTVVCKKIHNEFFWRVTYNKSKDMFVRVNLIPTALCQEHIGTEYYVEKFLVTPSPYNKLQTEEFTALVPGENIYKRTMANGKKIGESNEEDYLLHYYQSNPLSVSVKNTLNGLQFDTCTQGFRGYNKLAYLQPLIMEYNLLFAKKIQIIKQTTMGMEVFRAVSAKEAGSAYKDKIASDNSTNSQGVVQDVINNKKNAFIVTQGGDVDNQYRFYPHNTDLLKTVVPLHNIEQELRRQMFEAIGVPQRIITIEGSAYNNLIVAQEDLEKNCLSEKNEILNFLTQCVRFISPNFLKQNYAYTVDHTTSTVLMKRKEQEVKILTGGNAVAPNDIREVVHKAPVEGGDELLTETAGKAPKELTPEEVIKQKRNTGRNGERVVKKSV